MSLSVSELEKKFAENKDNQAFIKKLLNELSHRRTNRAKTLQRHALLARAKPYPEKVTPPTPKTSKTPPAPPSTSRPVKPKMRKLVRANTDITGLSEAERIFMCWTALEVLAPQSFKRAEDLTNGEKYRIAPLKADDLPWENGGERSKKKYRLYYQIILGTIDMPPAISELLKVYSDTRQERPQSKGKSVIATVLVDKHGRPVDHDAYSISSFAWGLPVALSGDLKALSDWPTAEAALQSALDSYLRHLDEDGKTRPLRYENIQQAYEGLAELMSLPKEMCNAPELSIKTYQYFKNDGPPETLLLNSFYLDDLSKCLELFKNKTAPANLRRYIGEIKPDTRKDLLNDQQALGETLHPSKMPLGSWPGDGRFPLVALQQTAVNLSASELKNSGILAVNGPPGTGKTTLLRDVVANVITERARVLATYDDPEKAFSNSQERIRKGQAFLWMYKIDEKLRGFEMVVASSNNKAVENISAELPARNSVAKDAFLEGYFKPTADTLLDRDSWGLIAAVLGNGKNKARFRQEFWWNEETGLSNYLRHVTGSRPQITYMDENDKPQERPPQIITQISPPSDKAEALARWKTAKKNYMALEKKTAETLAQLSKIADIPKELSHAKNTITSLKQETQTEQHTIARLRADISNTEPLIGKADIDCSKAETQYWDLKGIRPGFISRIFQRQKNAQWLSAYKCASQSLDFARGNKQNLSILKATLEKDIEAANRRLSSYQHSITDTKQKTLTLQVTLEKFRANNDGLFIDETFFGLPYSDRQLAAPWLDKTAAKLRQDLFEASMDLHRKFIDAAAKPLRHNIGLLLDSFGSRSFGTPERDALIPHLWASLFLVVPIISTTFASVGRMFGRLDAESLGWLLIDEAGQALPQAAAGAIMRCRRAIVVGDPMQIEPVVMLPDHLTDAICRGFKIDETLYNAPAASAQTLSDSATAYYASFETKHGARNVGIPLLVHRRCEDPMFGISNTAAYQGLMVQAKTQKTSPIKAALGSSRWIDVQGTSQDKWCAKEGKAVMELLHLLKKSGAAPDIYIVTPFVIVQNNLRQLISKSGILEGWVERPNRWPYDRIGTVHTVQGREAEAVIFVLGAPDAGQSGARNWAGGRPNLLNVAVSRAKEVIYVIGNKSLWERSGVFAVLAKRL